MSVKQLFNIQQELKAPKDQKNDFGNFRYRSAESILEAVKPILKKYECILTLTDEVVTVGDRNYIKATATLTSLDDEQSIKVDAYAREPEAKKGMDDSQVTGASSSYARKYALNGLFCIDDTKDPDSNEYTEKRMDAAGELATAQEKKVLEDLCAEYGLSITDIIAQAGWKKGAKLTKEQCGKAHIIIKEITEQ